MMHDIVNYIPFILLVFIPLIVFYEFLFPVSSLRRLTRESGSGKPRMPCVVECNKSIVCRKVSIFSIRSVQQSYLSLIVLMKKIQKFIVVGGFQVGWLVSAADLGFL